MQVFVPLSDSLQASVEVLDKKRLFKQLLEASQLLDAIADKPTLSGKPRTGWKSHPALLAWKHNVPALAAYALACADECDSRGIKSTTLRPRIEEFVSEPYDMPAWWGDDRIHSSHRARLLTKDYDFYSQFGWQEAAMPDLADSDYEWPIWKPGSAHEYTLEQRRAKLTPAQRAQREKAAKTIAEAQKRLAAKSSI